VDLNSLEDEVHDHLYRFFRRYYSEGDFLAKRVYKAGVYAIPYEGEEVKLYWANADQYYIKTSEYLRDYAFRLLSENEKNPKRVHFRLVDAAEGEHGNVKEAMGKERRFKLASDSPVTMEADELVIRFTYEPNSTKQKELNTEAEQTILAINDAPLAEWLRKLGRKHVRSDGTEASSTRLRVHLDRYTARNTFDYFIHKDLGRFLRRELDFFIKNEVMHLDDVENESTPRVEQYLSKIRVIRKIAGKIIEFLAQLENFQKKLWLKKKFVVETSWCIRLGCIPEKFYPEIVANDAQREEWIRLYAINELKGDLMVPDYTIPLEQEFLKAHPSLVVDTRNFSSDVVAKLLEEVDNLDEQTDALLFHAENAQSLELMRTRFRQGIDSVYIDPPYNTAASSINYKNAYRDSSWLALIDERLQKVPQLLELGGILCITIDDVEAHNLRVLMASSLAQYDLLGVVPIKNNPAGRTGTVGFSVSHEYALFYGLPGETQVGRLEHSAAQKARYKEQDDISAFEWTNFRKRRRTEHVSRCASPSILSHLR
jgi:adenine-specific DNA-methyltransferase